jgi:hypothetical protein
MSFTYVGQSVSGTNSYPSGSTFSLPSGTQEGDLLTILVQTSGDFLPTIPGDWTTRYAVNKNNAPGLLGNVVRGYIVRGASTPGNILSGYTGSTTVRIVVKAYRPTVGVATFVSEATVDINEPFATSFSWTGLTGLQTNDLLDMGLSSGRGISWGNVDAVTDPTTASSGTVTTGMPAAGAWHRRVADAFVGSSSHSWLSACGVKSSAGDTGNFTVTCDINAAIIGSVLAFRAVAPAGPVITGPSGSAGAASITHAVAENQNSAGTWSATGGSAWSLTGTDASLLSISSGGVVTLASGNFDHEAKASYSFNVLRDAVAQAVTLNITDQAEAPLAPTIGTATAGNASASVAFTAPNNTGRPAITGYTATSSPGGLTGTGASSPITVSGLTNGTPYTFTVTATNDEGTGPPSAASNSVTPSAPGTAPSITVQPASQTVTAGATATFSVTATGSGLTYQWRRNGTNISGATSSSYTTPATTVSGGSANNGDLYSVVVTGDTAPAATSSNATLTVNAAPPPPSGPTLPAVATDATGSTRRTGQTTRMVVEPFTNIESLGTGTRTIATGTTDATTGEITLTGLAAGTYAVFGFFPSTGATIQGVRFRLVTVS